LKDTVEQTLRETRELVAWLEEQNAPRERAEAAGRDLLGKLIKRRQRAQQRGVPTWEGAQRGALRMLVLAAGCVALIAGGSALDSSLAVVSIVVSLGVLGFEGIR
jgi:hypothetical protein